jgi:type III pantothenate kinase
MGGPSLWLADVGNTRIHAAVVRGGRLRSRGSVPTRRAARLPRVEGPAAACSVVPAAEAALRRRWPRVLFLGRDFPPAVAVRVPHPDGVGADRLANAAAAWARARRACVVVDAGSAVTFDVVSARGAFVGGAIAPGLGLAARALHEHCALLPRVRPGRAARAVGRTTVANIRSGLYWGMRGAIRETLEKIRRELGGRPRVFGTGGDAALVRDLFDEYIPTLTLEGVALSYAAWTRS